MRTCATCGGAGACSRWRGRCSGSSSARARARPAPAPGGSSSTPCRECSGAGRVAGGADARVEVPAGIHDGQRIRLAGEGHAGDGGGRAGDVYVLVRVRPDARFVREGNDVFSTVDLTITQAALGASVTVPTLEGEARARRSRRARSPAPSASSRGKGMPVLQGFGRGDQRVLVNVVVPRRLTDEQRDLLERVRRPPDGETYRGRRRGVLRQAEERVPLTLRRVSVSVPLERAEPARAQMLELFPEGFEEVDGADGVELVAYTDGAGQERFAAVFGAVDRP